MGQSKSGKEIAKQQEQATEVETVKDFGQVSKTLQTAYADTNHENFETLTGTSFKTFMETEEGVTEVFYLEMGEAPDYKDRETNTPCPVLTDIQGVEYFCRDAVIVSTAQKLQAANALPCVIRVTTKGIRKGSNGEYADLIVQRWTNSQL